LTIITRKSDYAARVLLHLATLPRGSWSTAQQIAERQSIPDQVVRHVVHRLAKANLLLTKRGRGGGIQIARPAADITLLNVVEAMQGPLTLSACAGDSEACPLTPQCPMVDVWVRGERALADLLAGETLQGLADRGEHLAAS